MESNQRKYSSLDVGSRTEVQAGFMTRVYQWMSIGVLLTAGISTYIGTNEALATTIATNRGLFWVLIIAQFGVVIGLSAMINRMTAAMALGLFMLYSALTGVTFSTIFLIYTQASIQSAFFTTACGFAGLSAFGFITKKDLGPVGTFCSMGLFGLIGYSLLSIFFPSMMGGAAGLVFSLVGLLIFAGLTAYDTQKIKLMGQHAYSDEERSKLTVIGALTLYLDFINLFLIILRFTGDRRR
ncbi:Bax inhibitor-1/YccA family protein [Bacteriovorax sp. PP10]|uniref:Bax inhibitor-1/YccA family protein n=1 Tax=Bacteriovorax antarcticus TaxID=3088717 RepID=A0ABU5VTV1_9BACT|nr:Bax inhibitor-1/YccA family protein [Bacteriovorax sp. PP10]MEA9356485.1 Bax inhibitor-1/YccA family protein [Bacteriovorax sp. PP10]